MEGPKLPDKDDRHVFAAAIKARAQVIVTNNLKTSPSVLLHAGASSLKVQFFCPIRAAG
ncbi:MAG: hypothetical protein DLM55_07130 [Acidimicrobiales bacterium]|nr:MAG: hypothetical protein DLM55_07130 [Acidimicrobiales bacterium]